MFNDKVERERSLALKFGIELLTIADELLVCGCAITDGMRGEIEKAKELGIPVVVFAPGLYDDIRGIAGDEATRYNGEHLLLVLNANGLFSEGGESE
jgi:hypothetical protein